ncbi:MULTISPECIES: saccharopine dehydrogenase family protein [Hyphomicrobium]|uniref:saccharopine dehydrogenase family protein n=1 Tax=Hyphomicrobium TaxID=81 RepID=UPI0003818A75|nr:MULTISPECIES: saccharopine dehydrogenase family protein [Hyphomicrobium]WBT37556.1 saccharopine dehydrogenase family protein [Hyphomicrobium sp. DMF-1]HML43719.1 saccharopine dehydrogenase family protein [Hyphomicrobium zavarzinii]
MDSVLIIGAGAAGSVTAQKCAMNRDVFKKVHLASRRLESCEKVAKQCKTPIEISQVDADKVDEVVALIERVKPDLLINMALPYQDLPIMDACLKTGVHYMDTANYEPRDVAKFEYSWQWAYQDRYKDKGIMAVLGCGFDPGVSNIFCAYAQEHLFDTIDTIDIIDCNDGSHGKSFATNFNPEINLREVTQRGKYWKDGKWIDIDPLSISCMIDYPEVGQRKSYLIYHEEEESLVQNIKGLKQIRFWMTFSDNYIKHLDVLQSVGMTRIDPVMYKGTPVIPMEFLKELLPPPSSLGENYTGRTSIGCIIDGKKDGKRKTVLIYNVCDHAQCYKETGAQAVSYTTGVPPVVGGMMVFKGAWEGRGVFNVEQLPSKPFLDELGKQGLPWHVKDITPADQAELFAVKT